MNKIKKISFVLSICLLIVFSGCVQLVKNGEETIQINYSKSGSAYFAHTIKGQKGEAYFNWEGDCTNLAKGIIDANISNFQKQSLEIKNSASLTQEEKNELIEENNRKINTLLSIKSSIKCSLKDENSMAVLEYSFNLTQGFANIKLLNSNYDFALIKTDNIIESKIKVNDTANQKTGNILTKISIYSEAEIKGLEPKENFEFNGQTHDINMLEMDGKDITIKINSKQQGTGPVTNGEEKKGIISLLIEGFMPEKIISLEKEDAVQWIPDALILLILIIITAKFVKGIKLPEKEETLPKEQQLEQKILSKEKTFTPKKKDFAFMREQINAKHPVKQMFTEEEKKQIKTIIMSLKESFNKYSKEEIKKAVMGKGYSDKVAQEVADFFYP
jgi:hypothetical protein